MGKGKNQVQYLKLYFWCLTFLKKYIFFIVISALFRLMFEICNVLIPKILQEFIDNAVTKNQLSLAKGFLETSVIVVIIMIVSNMLCKSFELVYVEKGTKEIQWEVYNKTRNVGFDYFDRTPKGEILSLLSNNVISVYFLFAQYVPLTLTVVITSVVATVMLAQNGSLFFMAIVIAADIAVIACNVLFERKIVSAGMAQADANMDYNRKAYDSVEAIEEIRAYDSTDWNSKRIFSGYDSVKKSGILMFLLGNAKSVVYLLCKIIGSVAYFSFCIYLLARHQITIGNVVSNFMYLSIAFTALGQLDKLIIEQNKNIFDAEKLHRFMKLPNSEARENAGIHLGSPDKIELRDVCFSYEENRPVLEGVSFSVEKGEKVALVGSSGAGKTTILKLLLNCYEYGGKILINGRPLSGYRPEDVKRCIGIAFQEINLFSGSILDNIRFGKPDASDDEIFYAAKISQVDDFVKKLPDGYNTELTDKGNSLSGGEKQRLALARILLKAPDVLLLDEITANLDASLENRIMQTLIETDKTIIFSAHRLSVIKKSDRIIVLENGKIAETGTFSKLTSRDSCLNKLICRGIVADDEKMAQ